MTTVDCPHLETAGQHCSGFLGGGGRGDGIRGGPQEEVGGGRGGVFLWEVLVGHLQLDLFYLHYLLLQHRLWVCV